MWLKRAARLLVLAGGVAAVVTFALRRGRGAAPVNASTSQADLPRIEGTKIHFSDGFVKRAGLRVQPVELKALVPVVAAVGTVEFDAEYVAAIGARLSGLVASVRKFEGDDVEAGEVLARVESAELGEAQARVSMLDAQYEAARLNADREARLAERSLTTTREVETATVEAKKASLLLTAARQKVAALGGRATAKLNLGTRELRTPIKGTIVERNIAPAQFIEGDVVAFKVADLNHLWIELDVFERNLRRVRAGDRAELRPLDASARAFDGRVSRISPSIDPVTHSAQVRIEVDNTTRQLRVGQAVKATIHATAGDASASPVVPTDAITFIDGKPTVFVAQGANTVRIVNVSVGINDGARTEVVEGLRDGDSVVTAGVFALKSELFR